MLKMYSYFSNPNLVTTTTHILSKLTIFFVFSGAIEFKKEPHHCVRLPNLNLI